MLENGMAPSVRNMTPTRGSSGPVPHRNSAASTRDWVCVLGGGG